VVDDNATSRQILQDILESFSFEVFPAERKTLENSRDEIATAPPELIKKMLDRKGKAVIMSAENEMAEIINYLEAAGMTGEERNFIEKEFASPKSIDSILPQIQGEELANQIYAVSLLAIELDTKAERDYLRYLQARLGISDQVARELQRQFEVPAEAGESGGSV